MPGGGQINNKNSWNINTWNDEDNNFDKSFKSYKEKTYKIIENLKILQLPKKNEQLRLISSKEFNTAAFINCVANEEIIEEAIFVIFTLNKFAAKIIIDLYYEGKIRKIKCLISSIRNAGAIIKDNAVKMIINEVGENFDVFMVNSHAKIMALKTESNYYILEGSGNMSANGRIEQYVFDNDENLFNFTNNWVDEMKIKMKNYKDFKQFK